MPRRPGSCRSATGPSSRSCSAALDRDLPVLAICRGSQVLNVALGGDLIQHLPDLVGHEGHKETPGTFSEHDVEIEPGSRLAGAPRWPGRGEVASPPGLRAARRRSPGRSPATRTGGRGARGPLAAASPSACSGTPRPARTRACSRRSSPRRPPTGSSGREPLRAAAPPRSCRTRSGLPRSGSRSGTRGSCGSSGRRAARYATARRARSPA